MWILIVSLIVLAVVAAVAGVIRNRRLRKQVESGELEAMPETVQVDSECCGQHEVCEKESLLAAVSKKIEYYDDEELDQYIGTPGDSYTAEQEEEFRDIGKRVAEAIGLSALMDVEAILRSGRAEPIFKKG